MNWQTRSANLLGALIGVVLLLATVGSSHAGELLRWDVAAGAVSADIEGRTLDEVLEQVAGKTGWEVFVEPGIEHEVSVKFADLPPGSALRRMLGDLNFLVIPQEDGTKRLSIYRTSASSATRQVRKAPATGEEGGLDPQRIGNELVVRLKDGESIDELAARLGATVIASIDELGLHRLRFEDEAAADAAKKSIDADPNAEADYNYAVQRPPTADAVAIGASFPLNLNPAPGSGADSLVVGLIDTYVQREGFSKPEFLLEALSLYGGEAFASGAPSHGTSMAEVLLRGVSMTSEGTANLRILSIDIYGNLSSTSTFDVARGINLAIEQGATIINLSLGGAGDAEYMRTMIANASANGVLFVASAGNQPVASPVFPAAYPEVLATTAGDRRGNVASYANYGDFVDIIAPGTGVVNFNGSAFMISGTSPASAYAAGAAAGLVSRQGLSPLGAGTQLRGMMGFSGSR